MFYCEKENVLHFYDDSIDLKQQYFTYDSVPFWPQSLSTAKAHATSFIINLAFYDKTQTDLCRAATWLCQERPDFQ